MQATTRSSNQRWPCAQQHKHRDKTRLDFCPLPTTTNEQANEPDKPTAPPNDNRRPRSAAPGCIAGRGPAESPIVFPPESRPARAPPPLSVSLRLSLSPKTRPGSAHSLPPRSFRFLPLVPKRCWKTSTPPPGCKVARCSAWGWSWRGAVWLTVRSCRQVYRSGAGHDLKFSHWYAPFPWSDEKIAAIGC